MVRKNNPELKSSLNQFIKTHKKGTLLGNIFFNRYYKDNKWIKNPLNYKGHKKLHYYIDLFKKYANTFNFDWMLIMALAYQESGLNHNKKSPFGAIGLMQIKPSTAASKKIGIHDVIDLENNIHAGIKYLALLKEHILVRRRQWSSQEKFKIILESLSERNGINLLCKKHKISHTQYYKWRDQFLKFGYRAFEKHQKTQMEKCLLEDNKRLKKKLGEIKVELKKIQED